ncbi:uncharacterized protein LOC142558267 [Dermacentor variabilis]|uniref:uncharacterized protein LOC142558267 n=1 Tax=Dermacentor variabilis TaxID=34621 RepID=UPI003F5BC3F5
MRLAPTKTAILPFARAANDTTRAPPTPPATQSTTVKSTVKITTPRKTTTTRTPSTGYGYTVCTIGRAGYDATMIPINEELCEIVIYTHIYVDLNDSTSISTTGRVSYLTFQKVARLQRGSKFMRFGVSYSPLALPVQLTANPSVNDRFLQNALEAFNASGFTVFGTMGLEKKIMDLKHEPALIKWYQALTGIQQRVPNATLFLGVRVLDDGKLLSTKKNLAKDLFQTVRDMKVSLVIFVTHNAFSMGNTSCTTVPVSSWSANAQPAGPALEQMFKFLEFGLKGEKTIEVALSSTLSFVMFEMKNAVKGPVKFGEKCVRSELLFFHEYCFEKLANEQEDVDTMTALGFVGTALFSFETPKTIEMKASVQSVLLRFGITFVVTKHKCIAVEI